MALIKCPDCSSDVSTEAPACPKCGRPIAPPTIGAWRPPPETAAKRGTSAKNIIGGVAAGIGVLVLLGYCASSVDTSTPAASSADQSASQDDDAANSSPAESRPIQTYTAERLYAMFHANEIKANNTIGNAIVRVTGKVGSIQQSDFSKTPELDILANCFVPNDCEDVDAWNTFRADLTEAEVSAAARLKIGQTVTLQCDKVSMPLDVYAKGCVIVPARSDSNSSD